MTRIRKRKMPAEQLQREADFYSLIVQTDQYRDESYYHVGDPIRFSPVEEFENRLTWFDRFAMRYGERIENLLFVAAAVLIIALVVMVLR